MKKLAMIIRGDGYDKLLTPLTLTHMPGGRRRAAEIYEYVNLLTRMGKVRLYGCRFAAAAFDVEQANLVPEAEGIVDPNCS